MDKQRAIYKACYYAPFEVSNEEFNARIRQARERVISEAWLNGYAGYDIDDTEYDISYNAYLGWFEIVASIEVER